MFLADNSDYFSINKETGKISVVKTVMPLAGTRVSLSVVVRFILSALSSNLAMSHDLGPTELSLLPVYLYIYMYTDPCIKKSVVSLVAAKR